MSFLTKIRLPLLKIQFLPTRSITKLTITDDGSTIVALHPEPKIPYEFSLPLPVEDCDISKIKSPLKKELIQIRKELNIGLEASPNADFIVRQKLAHLTHTCVHRWFPRSRDRRIKKKPIERPFL